MFFESPWPGCQMSIQRARPHCPTLLMASIRSVFMAFAWPLSHKELCPIVWLWGKVKGQILKISSPLPCLEVGSPLLLSFHCFQTLLSLLLISELGWDYWYSTAYPAFMWCKARKQTFVYMGKYFHSLSHLPWFVWWCFFSSILFVCLFSLFVILSFFFLRAEDQIPRSLCLLASTLPLS